MRDVVVNILEEIGGLFTFLGSVIVALVRGPFQFRELVYQSYRVGVQSLMVIFLAGGFVGAIIAIQFSYPLEMLGADVLLGGVVSSAIMREVGPMLIAAMIAGRIGAYIVAELGTMKVTEQVDVVRCLGLDPMTYLVVPRFLAVWINVFLLTIFGVIVALVGGLLVSVLMLGSNPYTYWTNAVALIDEAAFIYALVKGVFFGLVVATVSCRKGMLTEEGAVGVGRSVRTSLVVTLIALFVVSYFLSSILRIMEHFAEIGRMLYL